MSIVFVELFIGLKIIPDTQNVMKLSAKSIDVMKSKTMSDDEKEAFMRNNSLTMFLTTLKFIGKFVLIFAILYGLVYLLELISTSLAKQLMESFVSLIPMATATSATLIYVWIRNVIRRKL
jgi:hypothetical protein